MCVDDRAGVGKTLEPEKRRIEQVRFGGREGTVNFRICGVETSRWVATVKDSGIHRRD